MEFGSDKLSEATDFFNPNNLIGEGGFGQVYRGVLRYTTVAIKILTEVSARLPPMYAYIYIYIYSELSGTECKNFIMYTMSFIIYYNVSD
jgi:hypothetical protein